MIRAAIVGMGVWGQNLVRHVQGQSSLIRFTAGTTRTLDKAQRFAAEHGIRLLPNYDAALADPDIDAVVLATPHQQHTDQIVAAARAGKHVFSEKPMGLDRESARRAAQACAEAGVTLGVGYNWRYQPALQRIRAMIDDGTLGRILHVEGNFCGPSAYRFPRGHWRHDRDECPAGGMTGRGVHVIDAMIHLVGPIDTVTAQSLRLAQDFGMDDTTSMLLRFRNGATGYLGTVIASAETWRMQLFGSRGWVEVGDVEHLHTWDLKVCLIDFDNVTQKRPPEVIRFEPGSTERAELEHFARLVESRSAMVTPDGDAVHNVAVFDAIKASIAQSQTIQVR
ncbi:MAG: Gfo/Idh/MocA family protein [Burkholderiaceae bacterium]